MGTRVLGVAASGDKVVVVDAEHDDNDESHLIVHGDFTLRLAKGARPNAYTTLAQEISDYAREKGIDAAVVKGSAVSLKGRPSLAHLEAAELRGVVICALANVCDTQTITKQSISRTFGDRKADEYIADEAFWAAAFEGELRAGSREAAFCIIARRQ